VTDCPRCGCPSFGFSSCYGHLKLRLADGATLSEPEREFVGFANGHRSYGWRSAGSIAFADLTELLEHFDEIDGSTRIVVTDATARRLGDER
jgi:hypothetical protein